jgi:hypothetical protein
MALPPKSSGVIAIGRVRKVISSSARGASVRCRVVSGELRLTDHDAVRSLAVSPLGELAWAPGDVPFVVWLAAELRQQ